MIVPVPSLDAWVSGEIVRQEKLNRLPAHILALYAQTMGGFRTRKPLCAAVATDAGGVANNTDVVVQFQTSPLDTDNMYASASPTQLTVQTPGWYRILMQIHWDTNTTGRRACKIMVNGTNPTICSVAADIRDLGTAGEGSITNCEAFSHLSLGATLYGNIYQTSGSVAHLVTTFSGSFLVAEWVAP